MNLKNKSKIIFLIKIFVLVLSLIILFIFLVYKIFGLSYFPWLGNIIGPQIYVANFDINGADWISETNLKCSTDGTMTCKVKAPEIMKKGAIIVGWNYESNASLAAFMSGDEIILDNKKTKFYAITIPRIEVSKVIEMDSLIIEFELGLNDKSIDLRIKSLEKLYSRWKFMFKYREKVSFLTKQSYKKFDDDNYNGVNRWEKRYIDIKEANSDYTLIHELAHAIDFNCTNGLYRKTYKVSNWKNHKYETDFNIDSLKLISESDEYEFVKLYNKYKKFPSNKRPLQDYSYTNEHEFFADAMTYYYDFKYEKQYDNIVNNEIVDAVEKLIKDIENKKICDNDIRQEFIN